MALRIGDLARRSGLATSALRYYEDAGLLVPSSRSEAGYRLYDEGALGRLQFIGRARALGLSLRQIHELVTSTAADASEERERLRHVVAHKLADTERRVTELTTLKGELEALYVRLLNLPARQECGHVGDCGCWLPTEEEVMTMAKEVEACCCCDDPDCDCGCC